MFESEVLFAYFLGRSKPLPYRKTIDFANL